jgi:hypothetical protein
MKKILILIALSLFFAGVQAQVTTKSEYQIGKFGSTLWVDVFVRVITIDDVVRKSCGIQITPTSSPAVIASITEEELEIILRKIDEIKVGNMNLNSDYFEKTFVTHTLTGHIEIGYCIKTKLDTTKKQQWFIKIKDGIYEYIANAPLMDIYKTLGQARAKLQSL